MPLIAVYGSLRKGCYNHEFFLGEQEPLATTFVSGKLYDLGSYPALSIPEEKTTVECEIYRVGQNVFDTIDNMEIGAGYTRHTINTPVGDAAIWRMHDIPVASLQYVVEPDDDNIVRWREP